MQRLYPLRTVLNVPSHCLRKSNMNSFVPG